MLHASAMQAGRRDTFNGCCVREWKSSSRNCSRLPILHHHDTIPTNASCRAGRGGLRQHGVVSAAGIRMSTSPFSEVRWRPLVEEKSATSSPGSGDDRWHVRAVDDDSVDRQADDESETGFDLNVAVLMAGFAFESYNSPKVRSERAHNRTVFFWFEVSSGNLWLGSF